MAGLNDVVRHLYPVEMRVVPRVLATPTEGGGLPIRRLKYTTRVYAITLRTFHATSSDADALDDYLEGAGDGRDLFTWTHPRSGVTYNCILDPQNPVTSRYVGLNHWEYDLQLLGVEAEL